MHIPFESTLKLTARDLRKNQTIAEKRLWQALRQRRCLGYKFLRQKLLLSFIADFYCNRLRLVIEVDGSSHREKQELDHERTCEFERYGLTVIRYTNDQVLHHLPEVLMDLRARIQHISTFPSKDPPSLVATSASD